MFVTLFVSLGFRFAFGTFYSAILDETGWLRAETAAMVSASMIVYAATAALVGYLFDRYGARVVFPIGAFCMGAGLMLCSASESLAGDRKSTRLNSSHSQISYAVFCLKKKTDQEHSYHF